MTPSPPLAAGASERADLDRIRERLAEEFGRLAGRRLLITGGAGFVGYYLVRSVLRYNEVASGERIRLTVYDNFRRGLPPWLRAAAERRLTLVDYDVTDPPGDESAGFDYIMHAASIASPTFYRRFPLQTMDANVRGLRRLLDACRERAEEGDATTGILFFSTSEVYGDPTPENIPTPESYPGRVSCVGPRACYDESKRYGETLAVTFARQFGLPVKIVRPFNNYGPGLSVDDGRLLSDFAGQVLAGDDIVMYSDGSPTRTFCYIADAVVGYYKALLHGRSGEAYNIGADCPEISVRELAERFVAIAAELMPYGGAVVRKTHGDRDYLVDNPQRRCPSIDKARRELGFEPEVELDHGLRKMLTWNRAQTQSGAAVDGVSSA